MLLSVTQTKKDQKNWITVNNKLEKMGKEAAMA
jgi:hypothetical protein